MYSTADSWELNRLRLNLIICLLPVFPPMSANMRSYSIWPNASFPKVRLAAALALLSPPIGADAFWKLARTARRVINWRDR